MNVSLSHLHRLFRGGLWRRVRHAPTEHEIDSAGAWYVKLRRVEGRVDPKVPLTPVASRVAIAKVVDGPWPLGLLALSRT